MSRDRIAIRERVAAHRERLRAAGRIYLNADLPNDLVEALDQIKEDRRLASRSRVIEEAVRFYIEQQRA